MVRRQHSRMTQYAIADTEATDILLLTARQLCGTIPPTLAVITTLRK